jgi:hypothetical protein
VSGDAAHRAGVEIVGRRSGAVIITGEIAEGDEVVVEGLQRLREGATVMRPGSGGGSAGPRAASGAPSG